MRGKQGMDFRHGNSFRWKFARTANEPAPRSTTWRCDGRCLWLWRRVPDQPRQRLTASSDPSCGSCSSNPSLILSRSPSRYPLHPRRWRSEPGWSNGSRVSWTWFLLAFGMAPYPKKKKQIIKLRNIGITLLFLVTNKLTTNYCSPVNKTLFDRHSRSHNGTHSWTSSRVEQRDNMSPLHWLDFPNPPDFPGKKTNLNYRHTLQENNFLEGKSTTLGCVWILS